MENRLETIGLLGFYPWHRAYLLVSTIQWGANLFLVAIAVRVLVDRGILTRSDSSSENRYNSSNANQLAP
jgi:hypothetical protein